MDPGTEEAGPAPTVQPSRSSPSPSPSHLPSHMDSSSTPADQDPTTQLQDTHTQTLAELQAEIETEAEAEAEAEAEEEEQQESPASSSKSRPVSGVVPPWWQRHERNISRVSQSSLRNTITLEDHTADPDSETSRGLWARNVAIGDHCVVQGKTGVGAYVVWNCVVQTLDVSYSSEARHTPLILFLFTLRFAFAASFTDHCLSCSGWTDSRSNAIFGI